MGIGGRRQGCRRQWQSRLVLDICFGERFQEAEELGVLHLSLSAILSLLVNGRGTTDEIQKVRHLGVEIGCCSIVVEFSTVGSCRWCGLLGVLRSDNGIGYHRVDDLGSGCRPRGNIAHLV